MLFILFPVFFLFTAYPVQNPPKYLPPIDQHSSHRGTNTNGTPAGAASQSREYLTWWYHHIGCGVRLLSVPGIRSRYDDWLYACINIRWIYFTIVLYFQNNHDYDFLEAICIPEGNNFSLDTLCVKWLGRVGKAGKNINIVYNFDLSNNKSCIWISDSIILTYLIDLLM